MKIAVVTIVALSLFFGTSTSTFSSVFTVDQWSLGASVAGAFPHFDGDGTIEVTNPLQTTYYAEVGDSHAQSVYSFNWNDTAGDFLIQASQLAADAEPFLLTTSSSNIFTIHTNQDLLFSYDMACDYNLPIDFMQVVCALGVVDNTPPNDGYVDAYVVDDTYSDWPASGAFRQTGQVILPAGREYGIAYLMRLMVDGPPSPGFATVDGYVHFTLSEVPEPAALFPLALAAMLLRRSRK